MKKLFDTDSRESILKQRYLVQSWAQKLLL